MQLPSRIEKLFANLFLILMSILLMLVISELLMKFLFFHPYYNLRAPNMLDGHGAELKVELIPDNLYEIQSNPKLGINAQGFRDHDFSIDKHGKKRIVFLGDSFTMGLNVKSEETIPKMLEKQLHGYEVDNMGVVGFGPDQELNVLEKYGFKLKPDLVIDAICALNDSGDIYKNGLYTINNNGSLEAISMNPVKSIVFTSFSSLINQINFIKNRDQVIGELDPLLFDDGYDLAWIKYHDSKEANFKFALMNALFQRMKEDINARKINFLAVIIPSYNNMCDDAFFKENNVDPSLYFANETIYQHILENENIPNINLVPYFLHLDKPQRCSLYDAPNAHLSALGNLYTAQIIASYMAQQSQN